MFIKLKVDFIFQKTLKVLILKGLMVGLGGLEPPTSPLSGVRSNQAELQTRIKTEMNFNCYLEKIKDIKSFLFVINFLEIYKD